MRSFLISGLAASFLMAGCNGDRESIADINIELDTISILCQLDIAIVSMEVGSPQSHAKSLITAREQCKDVLSNDERLKKLGITYLIEKFDSPDIVRLKDVFIRENISAPYQKEIAGKISVKNSYGDYSEFQYFNMHINNVTFDWVLNFEKIPY